MLRYSTNDDKTEPFLNGFTVKHQNPDFEKLDQRKLLDQQCLVGISRKVTYKFATFSFGRERSGFLAQSTVSKGSVVGNFSVAR